MTDPSIRFALLVLALALAGTAVAGAAHQPPGPQPCPTGYLAREVRLDHQRLEPDPRPDRSPVVVHNTWPEDTAPGTPPDRRYVVALACVRPLTPTELDTEPYTDQSPR